MGSVPRVNFDLPARPSAPRMSPSWEWVRSSDHETLSRAAADRIAAEVRRKPDALICLAAGASTRRTYELMVASARGEPALYAQARWIKLDEWGGLAADDPATCETFLRDALLDPLAVPPARYCGWNGRPANVNAECDRIAAWLAQHGPIDLQILGLGANGHLGFNEPGTAPDTGPHVAQLSPTSLSHAMLTRARAPVAFGLTLGLGDILRSHRVFLLVSGAHKSGQLQRLARGELSREFPASLLHRHTAVTVFCDDAAAAQLSPPDSATAILPRPDQRKS